MDKLSGLASKLGGGSKGESHSSGSSGDRDYVDKGMYICPGLVQMLKYTQLTRTALDSAEQKFGGGKIDPNSDKTRQTNEKITDAGRDKFESMTGYVVFIPSWMLY